MAAPGQRRRPRYVLERYVAQDPPEAEQRHRKRPRGTGLDEEARQGVPNEPGSFRLVSFWSDAPGCQNAHAECHAGGR